MAPGRLSQVLSKLGGSCKNEDGKILVGFDTMDDAGVYELSHNQALVQTVDFFTPVADDPFTFGQIAAANSLSDVYAMGGIPLTALSIGGFPDDLDSEIISEILRGGEDKLIEANVTLLGGHTVSDPELKYGFSVTGLVHPKKIITNSGANVGQVLILTKPLGTACAATALKIGVVVEDDIREQLESMKLLNKDGSRLMQKYGVKGGTDVTGFGLIGHSVELATSSNVSMEIEMKKLPVFNRTWEFIKEGYTPQGTKNNLRHFGVDTDLSALTDDEKMLFADPQTSGGLLLAIDEDKAESFLKELNEDSIIKGAIIGRVIEKNEDFKVKVL